MRRKINYILKECLKGLPKGWHLIDDFKRDKKILIFLHIFLCFFQSLDRPLKSRREIRCEICVTELVRAQGFSYLDHSIT